MSQKPITIDLVRLDGHEGVRILSQEISRWFEKNPGARLKDLAERAGLSRATVSKIHARETQQPRLTTVVLLLRAFGFVAARFD